MYIRAERRVAIGLGRDEEMLQNALKIIEAALQEKDLKIIIDGDGLFALLQNNRTIALLTENVILTPNVNEWRRLEAHLNATKVELKSVLVKKGETDEISRGDERLVCDTPGSVRRCGGQGDILAGSIAAFIVHSRKQPEGLLPLIWGGCDVVRKAQNLAFSVHKRSMTAQDVIAHLPEAVEV